MTTNFVFKNERERPVNHGHKKTIGGRLNRWGATMRSQLIVSSLLFFGTIGLIVLLIFLKEPPKDSGNSKRAPLVEVVSVRPYKEKIKLNVSGVAVPFREIKIAAEVSGTVTEKFDACEAGNYVEGGVHLLSIDSERYDLKLRRANSELIDANARKNRAEQELKVAQNTLILLAQDLQIQSTENQKRETLFTDNAISETEMTQSRRALIAAKNAVNTQTSRVEVLKADVAAQTSLVELKKVAVEEAQLDVDNAIIKSPRKGVIIEENVEKDDFVQIGSPLIVFEDTSAIEVKCELRADQLQQILDSPEARSAQLKQFELPRLTAKITYVNEDMTYEWTGKLERYDGLGLNERTRTAPCRILVKETVSKEHNRTLVRGMYVSVELDLGVQENLVAIPAEAVRAGNVVWINDGSKLRRKPIKVVGRIISASGEPLVIARNSNDGLSTDESIVLSPIPMAVEGMEIRVAKASSEKGSADVETTSKGDAS